MTAFADQFKRFNVLEHENELKIALAKFSNAGGTFERLIALAKECWKGKLSEGQARGVRENHLQRADAKPPMPEGHNGGVREDQSFFADGQPISGEDHAERVREDQSTSVLARDSVSPMPGEGHVTHVREDQSGVADARLPIAGEAMGAVPDEGQYSIASSRDPNPSDGATVPVPETANICLPPARVPVAEQQLLVNAFRDNHGKFTQGLPQPRDLKKLPVPVRGKPRTIMQEEEDNAKLTAYDLLIGDRAIGRLKRGEMIIAVKEMKKDMRTTVKTAVTRNLETGFKISVLERVLLHGEHVLGDEAMCQDIVSEPMLEGIIHEERERISGAAETIGNTAILAMMGYIVGERDATY